MKTRSIIFVILILSLVFIRPCLAEVAEGKICSIDLLRVFDEYKKRKDFDKELEAKKEDIEAERNKLIDELKEIQDKMALVSDKEKEKKQKQLSEKGKKLQDFDQKIRIDLRKNWDEKLRSVVEDIKKTVEVFAKKEGCDFVIDNKVLLYSDKKSDITDKIIKILNKKYKK